MSYVGHHVVFSFKSAILRSLTWCHHLRPQGGKSLRTIRDFMLRLYNVGDMQASVTKILDIIKSDVPADNTLILMGHNGPAGLGAEAHNICGVDWVREAGDHGDPDLDMVLQQLRQEDRPVALVVFGHMHHTLRGRLTGLGCRSDPCVQMVCCCTTCKTPVSLYVSQFRCLILILV